MDSFESDEKNKGKRYREFLYYCFMKFEEQIKKIKSKKIINCLLYTSDAADE